VVTASAEAITRARNTDLLVSMFVGPVREGFAKRGCKMPTAGATLPELKND
jgi:hypothetical protein